ncbi:hypothetical protein WN55_01839 [Dufourea novaeangliae]|uniref:Secreted protein n=1 Tax=Dufourea novaeangliae TaxID=178035 RepID=A0A154PGV9_DUFNO|nr:hypothetical protein WN55_01839 [Dufourea novaeangliae]
MLWAVVSQWWVCVMGKSILDECLAGWSGFFMNKGVGSVQNMENRKDRHCTRVCVISRNLCGGTLSP